MRSFTRNRKKKKEKEEKEEKEDSSTSKNNQEFFNFSKKVLDSLACAHLPPTPTNFQIYFEKLTEAQPLSLKNIINNHKDIDNTKIDEHRISMEADIKKSFQQIRSLVKNISVMYKNLTVMKSISKKSMKALEKNIGLAYSKEVLASFDKNINALISLTDKQMEDLKYKYKEIADNLLRIEEKTIYNSKYQVYNRKYFLLSLAKELKMIKEYNHTSSVAVIYANSKVDTKFNKLKAAEIAQKSMAKLLMEYSRRSDIVAYLRDNLFVILMKHTDEISAKKACEKFKKNADHLQLFVNETEISLEIEHSIAALDSKYNAEEIVSLALEKKEKNNNGSKV